MPDLSALKQKVADLKTKVAEKVDQITFLKTWREKRQQNAAKGPDPLALSEIYRQGTTWTRLQVLAVYLLGLIGLASGGYLGWKFLRQMRSSSEHEKLVKEMSEGLEKTKEHAIHKAQVVSLGVVSAAAYVAPGKSGTLTMDLWIRVNTPEAAAIAETRSSVFHDKATAVLDDLSVAHVSLLSIEGKEEARRRLREAFTSALSEGQRVEEVFIQNLMVQ